MSGGGWRFTPEQLQAADQRLRSMIQPHEQLQAARQQAEGYRNFIASLTGLVGAVFVLKGRDNLTDLPGWWRWAVIGLLLTAFALLITASWLTVTAAHGPPGHTPTLDAGRVLAYELSRTRTVWQMVNWARWLTLLGVLAIAVAVLFTWIAPVPDDDMGSSQAATVTATAAAMDVAELLDVDVDRVAAPPSAEGLCGREYFTTRASPACPPAVPG